MLSAQRERRLSRTPLGKDAAHQLCSLGLALSVRVVGLQATEIRHRQLN